MNRRSFLGVLAGLFAGGPVLARTPLWTAHVGGGKIMQRFTNGETVTTLPPHNGFPFGATVEYRQAGTVRIAGVSQEQARRIVHAIDRFGKAGVIKTHKGEWRLV